MALQGDLEGGICNIAFVLCAYDVSGFYPSADALDTYHTSNPNMRNYHIHRCTTPHSNLLRRNYIVLCCIRDFCLRHKYHHQASLLLQRCIQFEVQEMVPVLLHLHGTNIRNGTALETTKHCTPKDVVAKMYQDFMLNASL